MDCKEDIVCKMQSVICKERVVHPDDILQLLGESRIRNVSAKSTGIDVADAKHANAKNQSSCHYNTIDDNKDASEDAVDRHHSDGGLSHQAHSVLILVPMRLGLETMHDQYRAQIKVGTPHQAACVEG